MGLPRAIEGARNTGLTITWTEDDGTIKDLTGAVLTGIIEAKDGKTRAISGTLALSDAANGVFTWAYSDADIATPGRYLVQFKATFTTYDLTYAEVWIVESALAVS